MLQAAFEIAQSLRSGIVEWNYAVVITTAPTILSKMFQVLSVKFLLPLLLLKVKCC